MKYLLAVALFLPALAFGQCADNCGVISGDCVGCHYRQGPGDPLEWPPQCEMCANAPIAENAWRQPLSKLPPAMLAFNNLGTVIQSMLGANRASKTKVVTVAEHTLLMKRALANQKVATRTAAGCTVFKPDTLAMLPAAIQKQQAFRPRVVLVR